MQASLIDDLCYLGCIVVILLSETKQNHNLVTVK